MAGRLHARAFLLAAAVADLALMVHTAHGQLLPAIGKADAAAGKKLDLTFVPGDAVAVIVLQPQRLVNSSLFPAELLALMGKDQLGFDLRDLAQATLIFGQPNIAQGDQPNFAFVLRFAMPMDTAALASKMVPQGNDAQIEGKRARISTGQHNLSWATVDGQTMLVAEEGGLTGHWPPNPPRVRFASCCPRPMTRRKCKGLWPWSHCGLIWCSPRSKFRRSLRRFPNFRTRSIRSLCRQS